MAGIDANDVSDGVDVLDADDDDKVETGPRGGENSSGGDEDDFLCRDLEGMGVEGDEDKEDDAEDDAYDRDDDVKVLAGTAGAEEERKLARS